MRRAGSQPCRLIMEQLTDLWRSKAPRRMQTARGQADRQADWEAWEERGVTGWRERERLKENVLLGKRRK